MKASASANVSVKMNVASDRESAFERCLEDEAFPMRGRFAFFREALLDNEAENGVV